MQLSFEQRWQCWEEEEMAFLNNLTSLTTVGWNKHVEVNNINFDSKDEFNGMLSSGSQNLPLCWINWNSTIKIGQCPTSTLLWRY